jgi:hypothetical protein
VAEFAGLGSFAPADADSAVSEGESSPPSPGIERRLEHGLVAGIEREVHVAWQADGATLRCGADHASLRLTPLPSIAAGSTAALSLELAAGPCLLLALASRAKFVLHASAARVGTRTLLFGGESGRGKSTLARAFGARALADDLVAVDTRTGLASTRGLQRKWPAPAQCALPETVSNLTWVSLASTSAGVVIEPMAPAEALREWLAHTAAARLFPETWTRAWLTACAEAAERFSAFRLSVPWRPEDPARAAREAVAALERHFE